MKEECGWIVAKESSHLDEQVGLEHPGFGRWQLLAQSGLAACARVGVGSSDGGSSDGRSSDGGSRDSGSSNGSRDWSSRGSSGDSGVGKHTASTRVTGACARRARQRDGAGCVA